MFIEEVLEIDNMVFKPQEDLKTPKYDKLEVWREGWESIDIGPYPTGNAVVKEIKKVQEEIKNANGETKQQYINCDEDASYYIKKYMDEHDLDYNEDTIEHLEQQCVPIIRHYKNFYNRARPYQVAAKLGMELDRFKTDTSKTPAYPSGHTVQPIVVAEYYSTLYPQHRAGLMKGAIVCGYGRVIAGLHYPSDYDSGKKLGTELMKYLDMGQLKEDAPMNSTGPSIAMPPTARKTKKKKKDIFKR